MYRHGVPPAASHSSKFYSLVDYIVVNLDDNKLKFLNHVLLEYGKVLNKMEGGGSARHRFKLFLS